MMYLCQMWKHWRIFFYVISVQFGAFPVVHHTKLVWWLISNSWQMYYVLNLPICHVKFSDITFTFGHLVVSMVSIPHHVLVKYIGKEVQLGSQVMLTVLLINLLSVGTLCQLLLHIIWFSINYVQLSLKILNKSSFLIIMSLFMIIFLYVFQEILLQDCYFKYWKQTLWKVKKPRFSLWKYLFPMKLLTFHVMKCEVDSIDMCNVMLLMSNCGGGCK